MSQVFYRPSNGTEGDMFFAQCDGCKHDRRGNNDTTTCACGISSKVAEQMWIDASDRDNPLHWFSADELDPATVLLGPAKCLKRLDVDAIRDCAGQLPMFDAPLPTK